MFRSSPPGSWRNIKSRINLGGNKCIKCQKVYFPKKVVCECGSDDFKDITFSGKGKVVTKSEVFVPPIDFEKKLPFTIGLIELEEGPRITSEIIECENVEIGMEVESCVRKIYSSGKKGIIHYGIKFRPLN